MLADEWSVPSFLSTGVGVGRFPWEGGCFEYHFLK